MYRSYTLSFVQQQVLCLQWVDLHYFQTPYIVERDCKVHINWGGPLFRSSRCFGRTYRGTGIVGSISRELDEINESLVTTQYKVGQRGNDLCIRGWWLCFFSSTRIHSMFSVDTIIMGNYDAELRIIKFGMKLKQIRN